MENLLMKTVISHELLIHWSDGTSEARSDFPYIEYIDEYLGKLEAEENPEAEEVDE
jgi:hypothetical protein